MAQRQTIIIVYHDSQLRLMKTNEAAATEAAQMKFATPVPVSLANYSSGIKTWVELVQRRTLGLGGLIMVVSFRARSIG
jgi:hypothetical protein